MNFFSKKKLKINDQSTKDQIKFCIDYFKLGDSNNFKTTLFEELFNSCTCLTIIDSNLSYLQKQPEKDELANKITTLLDSLHIEYKKLIVKSSSNGSGLKALINAKNKDKGKEYIIGFVISRKDLQIMKPIFEEYNTHYYISSSELNKDELLEQVEVYYHSEDELLDKFSYNIFDCNSIKNLVINSKSKDSALINSTINKLEKEFNS